MTSNNLPKNLISKTTEVTIKGFSKDKPPIEYIGADIKLKKGINTPKTIDDYEYTYLYLKLNK
jgi:hypothetical protein